MPSKLVSALAAFSLMAAPTMAVAQPEPDTEAAEESNRGGIAQLLPILVIIAVVLLARELVKDRDSGLNPRSP